MSDVEEVSLESTADEATQTKARKMGWHGPDKYTGDPERFVDADEYLRRGEEVLPIIKQKNAELRAMVEGQSGTIAEMKRSLDALTLEQSAVTARRVEEAKEALVAQLKEAIETNDVEAQAKILGTLAKADKVTESVEWDKKTERRTIPKPIPEFYDWVEGHPWYGKSDRESRRKTYIAQAIAADVKDDFPDYTGKRFYDEVDKRIAKEFRRAPEDDKVEGGSGRGESSNSDSPRGYSDMPADARKQCDLDSKQFVGEGKMFKDMKSFRAHWAAQYDAATRRG